MGAMSRTKGQSGEREVAALLAELTGKDVRRRVRQHDGDADLEGLEGWSVEVKRYRVVTTALLTGQWWPQAVAQAHRTGCAPLMIFRGDRQPWRAAWPVWLHLDEPRTGCWDTFDDCLVSDPLTWHRMTRRLPLERLQAFARP